MKVLRSLLALVALASVAGVALVAKQVDPAGARVAVAAEAFLNTLKQDQKDRAVFAFDSAERTNWNYTPVQSNKKPTRKGLPLEAMTAEQKTAALELLKSSAGADGDKEANLVRSLELVLLQEEKNSTQGRNPEWYFFSIFGTPSKTDKWGWRFEGHHVSFNFTMEGGQIVASTPNFIGTNPAEIKEGDKKGLKVIGPSDDLERELINSLDDEEKKIADKSEQFKKGFPESTEKSKAPNVGEPVGLAAGKMTDKQREILTKLMKHYTDRMPAERAEQEWKDLKDAGFDKIYFAYTGTNAPGKGHTYRIHGPTFIVEFINIQADGANNPANHIHSAWRRMKGDFGLN